MTYTLRVEVGFGGASTSDYLHLDDPARGILDTNTLGPADGVWTNITAYVHRLRTFRGVSRIGQPIPQPQAGNAVIDLNNSDRRFDPTNLSGPYVSGGVTQVTPMRAVRILATYGTVTWEIWRGFADEWRIDYDEPSYSLCQLTCTDATKVLANYDRGAVAAVGASEDTGARISRILDSAGWSDTDRLIATGDTTVQATTLEGPAWDEMLLTADTEIGELYIDEGGRVFFRNRQASMEDLRSTSACALFGDSPNPGVDTTINLATNPSAETDLTNWAGGGAVGHSPTLTRSNTRAVFGTYSVLATWANATGPDLPLVQYTATGLIPGRTYTMSVYAYVPTGSPSVALLVPSLGIWGTGTFTVFDTWVRLTWSATTPTSSLLFQVWPFNSVTTAGQECYLDGLQIEEGSLTAYCDGDQSMCEWDGTDHASTSRRLPELPYADVEVASDDSPLVNLASITRVGGSEQTAEDAASRQQYLTHTHRRSDLIMQTDSAALDYAEFVVYQSKDPELRFATLEVRPRRDEAALFPQVLGRRLGDRIRIIRRPPGGGTITRDAFIRGVQHDVDNDRQWVTLWALQSATKWSFLTLDHATLGVLDSNALSY